MEAEIAYRTLVVRSAIFYMEEALGALVACEYWVFCSRYRCQDGGAPVFTPRPGPSVNTATAGPGPEQRLGTEAGAARAGNVVTSCRRLNDQALIASYSSMSSCAQRFILMIVCFCC